MPGSFVGNLHFEHVGEIDLQGLESFYVFGYWRECWRQGVLEKFAVGEIVKESPKFFTIQVSCPWSQKLAAVRIMTYWIQSTIYYSSTDLWAPKVSSSIQIFALKFIKTFSSSLCVLHTSFTSFFLISLTYLSRNEPHTHTHTHIHAHAHTNTQTDLIYGRFHPFIDQEGP